MTALYRSIGSYFEGDADELAEGRKRSEFCREISCLSEGGREALLKICDSRPDDETAKNVRRRLSFSDGGKYHQMCYKKFCAPASSRKPRGRPENENIKKSHGEDLREVRKLNMNILNELLFITSNPRLQSIFWRN